MSTHNTPFSFFKKKKITHNYPNYAGIRFCSKGLKKEFETAVAGHPCPMDFFSTLFIKS